jgi:hypothetical protein
MVVMVMTVITAMIVVMVVIVVMPCRRVDGSSSGTRGFTRGLFE